jgi:hypothetical protein
LVAADELIDLLRQPNLSISCGSPVDSQDRHEVPLRQPVHCYSFHSYSQATG